MVIVYLAGAETWFETFVRAGVRNVLWSYFYMRKMRQKKLDRMIETFLAEREHRKREGKPQMRMFLDSGAFTLLYHGKPGDERPDPGVYAADFVEFVKRTWWMWDAIAEMDIDDPKLGAATAEDIAKWRLQLLEATEARVPIVHTWHRWHGKKWWQQMVDDNRFPYLGIGSGEVGVSPQSLLAIAHRAGKRVHGFAETKLQTQAKYLKYDSVDSTTWLRATKYGGFFVFHNNQLRIIDHKHKEQRKLFKKYYETNGIDMDKVLREDQEELTKASLIAWRNMAARYEAQGAFDLRNRSEGDEAGRSARPHAVSSDAAAGPDREPSVDTGDAQRDAGVDHPADARASDPRQDDDREAADIERGAGDGAGDGAGIGGAGCAARLVKTSSGWRLQPRHVDDRTPVNSVVQNADPWASVDPADPMTWGARCIAARNTGHRFLKREIEAVNEIGSRLGCSTCPAKEPGTPEGNWVKDHFPDSSTLPDCSRGFNHAEGWRDCDLSHTSDNGGDVENDCPRHSAQQVLRPQCWDCSLAQGGGRNKSNYEAPAEAKPSRKIISGGFREMLNAPAVKEAMIESALLPAPEASSDIIDLAAARERRRQEVMTNGAEAHAEVAAQIGREYADELRRDLDAVRKACENDPVAMEALKKWLPGVLGLDSTGALATDEGEDHSYGMPEGFCGTFQPSEAQEVVDVLREGGVDAFVIHDPKNRAWARGLVQGQTQPIQDGEAQGERERVQADTSQPTMHATQPSTPGSYPGSESNRGVTTVDRESSSSSRFINVYEPSAKHLSALAMLDKLPGVQCSNCAMSGECPEYQEGAACAFGPAFKALPIRQVDAHLALAERLLQVDIERTERAIMLERVQAGGQLDPRVSQQIDRLRNASERFTQLRNSPPASVRFTAEMTSTGGASPSEAGNMLAKLFGGAKDEPATSDTADNHPAREPIDIE